MIKVALNDQKHQEVTSLNAYYIKGDWAITPFITGIMDNVTNPDGTQVPLLSQKLYTITHIPTGLSLCDMTYLRAAMRAVDKITRLPPLNYKRGQPKMNAHDLRIIVDIIAILRTYNVAHIGDKTIDEKLDKVLADLKHAEQEEPCPA